MSVIVIANQKGGCGKSTTAVHLARWLANRGSENRVCVVDADAQRSSSIWLNALPAQEQPSEVEVIGDSDGILDSVPEIAKAFDWVIVDCPGGILEVGRAALLRADCVFVPIQPTGLDIRSAADSTKLIKQAQSVRNGPPQTVTFISRGKRNTKSKAMAQSILEKLGFPVMKTVIHQKEDVAALFGKRTTAFDTKGRALSEAAREYDHLFTEAFEQWQI